MKFVYNIGSENFAAINVERVRLQTACSKVTCNLWTFIHCPLLCGFSQILNESGNLLNQPNIKFSDNPFFLCCYMHTDGQTWHN
jgi:hypothetical protein